MSVRNYKGVNEVTVHTQAELDDIPLDYAGRIYIVGKAKIIMRNRYGKPVTVCDSVAVQAYGNSRIIARGYSKITAFEYACVIAGEHAVVTAKDYAFVTLSDFACVDASDLVAVHAERKARVLAKDRVTVLAEGKVKVRVKGNSSVVADYYATVLAEDKANVIARKCTQVKATGYSIVEARDWAIVTVEDCATAVTHNNAQVVDYDILKTNGNADKKSKIVPRTLSEFLEFYNIEHTNNKAMFYKAVHKTDMGKLISNYDSSFEYKVGEYKEVAEISTDINEKCGSGIHIVTLDHAWSFGFDWPDMTLLEVETDIKDIVLPIKKLGELRTSKIKVLREVPITEWGVYGTVYANWWR